MSKEISQIDNFSFRVIKKVGLAINRFKMIKENDRIIVAVSGGKDSLTLLKALVIRKLWVPLKYEIVAVNVQSDMHCSGCVHKETLKSLFEDLKIEYHFEEIEILKKLKEKGEQLNCFFCSWNRRKALFLATRKYNCNKIWRRVPTHKTSLLCARIRDQKIRRAQPPPPSLLQMSGGSEKHQSEDERTHRIYK